MSSISPERQFSETSIENNWREVVVNFDPLDHGTDNDFVLIAANQDLNK